MSSVRDSGLRGKIRERSLLDFWFFQRKVLDNRFLEKRLHEPISRWVQDWSGTSKKLFLMSRGHIKSNIVTVAFSLWLICQDPNVRILLGSHKDPDAMKFLRAIKRIISDNRKFRWLFPEIRPAMGRGRESVWNERQILVNRSSTAIENTVEITSTDTQVTGRHYDWFIGDDLVTAKNVMNPSQIEKIDEFRQLCESLLDPGACEFLLGTRYDFGDLYGKIQDDPDLAELYDIRVQPAHDPAILHEYLSGTRKWTREDDYAHLIHPQRFTLDMRDYKDPEGREWLHRKSLPATYRSQGPTVYATQYMLEPFDPATALFHADDFIEVNQLPPGPLRYVRLCDLSSDKGTDSYTVILTGCSDQDGYFYITDIFWKTCEPSETCAELLRGQRVPETKRPVRVSFEKGPYEKAIIPWLRRMSSQADIHIPKVFLPGSFTQKAKETRIMGLEPYTSTGTIRILRGCRNKGVLIEEAIKFPKFKRRDCIDALAHMPIIVYGGKKSDVDNSATTPIDWKKANEDMLKRAVDNAIGSHGARHALGGRSVMRPVGRQAFDYVRFGRG